MSGGIPRKQTALLHDKVYGPPAHADIEKEWSRGLDREIINPMVYVDMATRPQLGSFFSETALPSSQRYFISFFFDSSNTDTPSWGMGNAIVVVVSRCRFTEFLCNAEAKIKEQRGLADVRIIHYQKVEPGDWLPEE